jgi:hypothetical protein
MSSTFLASPEPFVDRRDYAISGAAPGMERRQFANSYSDLAPDARELGVAIDQYKLHHRRRFINFDELLAIIRSLGYEKKSPGAA